MERMNAPSIAQLTMFILKMGQFIQEGSRTMFETIVDVKKPAQDLFIDPLEGNFDGLNFLANQNSQTVRY